MHCQGHSKGNTLPEEGNRLADYEARLAAERKDPVVTPLIANEGHTGKPVNSDPSDYKWIQDNKGKLLENGWGQLETDQLVIPERALKHCEI